MLPLAQSKKVIENREMMSKIRNFLSKFKKKQSNDEIDINEETSDIDNDNNQNNNDDLTSEIIVKTDSDHDTSENNPSDDYDYDIDLNQKLTIKDRIEQIVSKVKDFTHRLNFNKFKVISVNHTDEDSKIRKVDFSKLKTQVNKIDFSKLYNEVFSPNYRTIINKVFLTTTLLLFTYITGITIGQLLTPTNGKRIGNSNGDLELDFSKNLTKKMINEIKNAKLFKSESIQADEQIKKPIKEVEVICKEASKKTSLPIKLINTVVLQDTVKSIASVQIRSSELQNVREGDKIDNIAEVGKIDRLGLIIKNLKDGGCEKIESEKYEPPKISKISVMTPSQSQQFKRNRKNISGIINNGNDFTIKKSFLQEKLADISNIITQAKGTPIPNPDGTLSFKITDVDPGGVFAYLGIQDNDIITNINGEKINDLNEVMNLFSRISTIDKLNLTVVRSGSEVPLKYQFK